MAILKDILYKVSLVSVSGSTEVEVNDIAFDSRAVTESSVFVAVRGTHVDGHEFIAKAVEAGARAVVCEKMPESIVDGVTYAEVKNSAVALGIISSNFFGNPSSSLKVIGVTGTNGKTTTVSILYDLFTTLKHKCGMISTVHNMIAGKEIAATHTTPDSVAIQKLMSQMVEEGCEFCFMEVSSHAAEQERISGIHFEGAVFSNISHDHLDYHGSFEAYIAAKKKLFDQLPASAFALVNIDDKRGRIMVQNCKATKYTFSLKSASDFKAKVVADTLEGMELQINGHDVWFKMVGKFNAYNLLSAFGVATLLGEAEGEVLKVLSNVDPAPGRFDQILSETMVKAIVDYAHTPDALRNVLSTIDKSRSHKEKLITVVGCGGNRDKEKRPAMAAEASKYSDKVILTSDNPRDEDPMQIIKEMKKGLSPADLKNTVVVPDREEAIKTACMMARENDIILVAGKGHEKYQEIKGVKYPFDDKEVLSRMLEMTK